MTDVFKDASGTVGTTAVTALAADTGRNMIIFDNPTQTGNLGINLTGTAVFGSPGTITVAKGAGPLILQTKGVSGPISVISDTANTPYSLVWC